jgi:hypothetical protein
MISALWLTTTEVAARWCETSKALARNRNETAEIMTADGVRGLILPYEGQAGSIDITKCQKRSGRIYVRHDEAQRWIAETACTKEQQAQRIREAIHRVTEQLGIGKKAQP